MSAFALQQVTRSAAEGRLDLPGGISLADPLFLAALIFGVVALYLGRAAARHAELRVPVVPADGTPLPATVAQRTAWIPGLLRFAAIALVTTGLARPLLGRVELSSDTEGIDIALLVDRSTSMDARDAPGGPRRVEIVRDVVADYAQRRTTDRDGAADDVALFAFAGYTDLLVPFTRDADALTNVIETLDVVQVRELDGTAIGVAVTRAVEVLQESEAKSKVIVLLTDGQNTSDVILPAQATEFASEAGVKVHVVYAGPRELLRVLGGFQQREVLDLTELEAMASTTGGKFFHAQDREALEAAYEVIEELERTPRQESRFAERFDLYPRFLTWALVLYGLAWILGATWNRRLP